MTNPYAPNNYPPQGPAPTRSTAMGSLGNILWIVLGGGIPLALSYFCAGALLACTIVGIPFAIAPFRIGLYAFLPFDKRVVQRTNSMGSGCIGALFNIGWLVTFGWVLALSHLVYALACAVTIVGLPFAAAHVKLATLALWPFGKEIV